MGVSTTFLIVIYTCQTCFVIIYALFLKVLHYQHSLCQHQKFLLPLHGIVEERRLSIRRKIQIVLVSVSVLVLVSVSVSEIRFVLHNEPTQEKRELKTPPQSSRTANPSPNFCERGWGWRIESALRCSSIGII